MKINLLLNPANRSWIIQKIAEMLVMHLAPLGMRATISDTPDPSADLVHHMSWAFANLSTPQPSTMFITHLDDVFKMNQVRATLASNVDVGICMSSDTMRQLERHGVNAQSLYYIGPAHDGSIRPRRTVIGITSRVYPDGRKRESLLHGLAQRMRLDGFEFHIFGNGWEPTIRWLEAAGASVRYFGESNDYRQDYQKILESLPGFDYYLYLGLDEGSLGTLDALCAGIPTIVTPQGFHLDLPNGITHPVVTLEDLESVFRSIATAREARVAAVQGLTWSAYASKHEQLWSAILKSEPYPALPQRQAVTPADQVLLDGLRQRRLMAQSMQPRRILSAVSHWPALRVLRNAIDRARLKR